jgi:hypothetical protein
MGHLSAFWGFLIGASIGTVATASTAAELRAEARRWITKSRWKVYLDRENWRFPAMLSAALDLLKIEILVILFFIWLFGLLWAIFLTSDWNNQYFSYMVGSLVGGAASPWIWLHFSRTFAVKKKGGGCRSRERLSRSIPVRVVHAGYGLAGRSIATIPW